MVELGDRKGAKFMVRVGFPGRRESSNKIAFSPDKNIQVGRNKLKR